MLSVPYDIRDNKNEKKTGTTVNVDVTGLHRHGEK